MAVSETNPQGNGKAHQSHNKAKTVISSLDQVFSEILTAFEICPEIQQALILFGSSSVTPKESYVIKLPHICPEADNVPLRTSKQALFRHLVAEQVLSSDAALGPTNVYVVLCAPRSAALSGFVPKLGFKIPTRGYCLTLNMICNQPSFCCQDLTMDDTEVEISGVEPLERSSFTDSSLPMVAGNFKSPSPEKVAHLLNSSDGSHKVRMRQGSGSDVSATKHEGETSRVQFHTPLTRSTPKVNSVSLFPADPLYIWFQSSTVIKGYRM
ncbi:uncharacterized protein LOC143281587 [Babylonia areolata]|uniref:uncharacterized protein LOC143281587 n=1 Tax=Babylonia areolata TaxID=304850 RepID=UPI003FD63AB7